MDRWYGNQRYKSEFVEDRDAGFAGVELHRLQNGSDERVASVIYWDASGHYFVQTFGTDVELPVLEELIIEAKNTVRIR